MTISTNPHPALRGEAIAEKYSAGVYYSATLEIRGPGGDLSPGFSITGETSGGTSGAIGDDLARVMPRLAAFARVHCADLDGTPMHGPANAADFLSGRAHAWDEAQYGREIAYRNGTGYDVACRILRVDEIPPACYRETSPDQREIIAPAWAAFIADCREQWAYDAEDAFRCFAEIAAEDNAPEMTTAARLAALLERAGLTIDWNTTGYHRDADGWEHLRYSVRLQHRGETFAEMEYRMGLACDEITAVDAYAAVVHDATWCDYPDTPDAPAPDLRAEIIARRDALAATGVDMSALAALAEQM